MATFGDLYQAALDTELGTNDSAVLFTTARRKHAINEGYRQFADLTECLTRQSTVTVPTSGQEFNLLSTTVLPDGDFLRISDQAPMFRKFDTAGTVLMTIAGDEDFPQREVQWLDAADQGWRSTVVGTPTAWYLRRDGGALYFGLDRPADVSTSETAELVIPYVPNPSSMTADTSMPFTISGLTRTDLQPYQQAIVHYAAHDLEKLRKDPAASDRQLQKFLGYVQRFIQATRPKGPRSVRAAKSYFKASRRGGSDVGPRAPWWYR
jgi:hypothetical protein